MAVRLAGTGGPRVMTASRDAEGHRTYKVSFLVQCTAGEGPAAVFQCPGLPTPGNYWNFGAPLNDVDIWAWCRADASIVPSNDQKKDGRTVYYEIEMTFSTKPPTRQRCQDNRIEDPLLEPMKISGTFVKYQQEATYQRDGRPIVNSAWEQIRGPQVEFDANRPQVSIEQNVPLLQLELFSSMVDTLNDSTLWGLPARCIKLSNVKWSRIFYGTCNVYYTRSFEFDIRYVINPFTGLLTPGWDKDVLDEGTKVLQGYWGRGGNEGYGWVVDFDVVTLEDLSPDNPANFMRAIDRSGNTCRTILDGHGRPYDATGLTSGTGDDQPGKIHIEYYPETNFLLLGIPTVLV